MMELKAFTSSKKSEVEKKTASRYEIISPTKPTGRRMKDSSKIIRWEGKNTFFTLSRSLSAYTCIMSFITGTQFSGGNYELRNFFFTTV